MINDPLRDYLDSMDWQAFDDRLPDLCCDHLRSFLRRFARKSVRYRNKES